MTKRTKGKKPGELGTGRGGGGAGEEGREKLTEVDKEWFQIQIRSLEDKLQRRNEKMKRLEQSNQEYQERFDSLREDKADIIAYLKRTLQQRTDQIAELQARLEGLQQVHLSDAEKAREKLANLEQEATKTKEQLLSENMVLTKKLDALEEFRIQRDQLMSKFEDQEKKREEMKRYYETKLEKLEKKHILEEDRLKKEMAMKLESVASEFRKASHAQMAATTQRTIRENVSITAEVGVLSERVAELTCDNEILELKNRDLKLGLEALEAEQKSLMERNSFRLRIIEELSHRCASQEAQSHRQATLQAERRQFEEKIHRLESELQEAKDSLQTNSSSVREKESTISEIKMRLAGISRTRDIINDCLAEASSSIKAALALHVTSPEAEDEVDAKTSREKVLNQLLNMLNTAIGEKKREQAQLLKLHDQSGDDNIDYLHGSLGLVPS